MSLSLNYAYRVLATGFCFSVFGIGGLVLSLFILPLQRIWLRDAQKSKIAARYTVHLSFKFFIRLMRGTGVVDFAFPTDGELAQASGKILIANHPSLIDVVALISLLPDADCVVKARLLRNPFMRGVIRSTGYLSNADPEGLLADCKLSLQQGNTLIIFPEGTRTSPGKPLTFQRGAANIALRSGCNLLACVIDCQPSTLTKHEAWYQVPSTRPMLTIAVLQEFDVQTYTQHDSCSIAARQLTRDLELFYFQALNNHGTT